MLKGKWRRIFPAAVVATTIGAGMIGMSPASATHFDAPGTTKVCTTSGNSLTFQCVLTLEVSAFRSLPAGVPVTVDLVGNAAYTNITVTGTCVTDGGVITGPTSLTITPTAYCGPGSTIVVAETLHSTGAGGGTLCQQPDTAGNAPRLNVCANQFTVPVVVGPPTDKDQCKNGGWMKFNNPAFKNQGDCVSFVATGGRNPGNG